MKTKKIDFNAWSDAVMEQPAGNFVDIEYDLGDKTLVIHHIKNTGEFFSLNMYSHNGVEYYGNPVFFA